MESHTFGFWPSFVCELAKWSFWSGSPDSRTVLRLLAARDFGEENADTVLQAWRLWSDGIRSYISTNEDQYGPCRIGPAYPLVLNSDVKLPYGPLWGKVRRADVLHRLRLQQASFHHRPERRGIPAPSPSAPR